MRGSLLVSAPHQPEKRVLCSCLVKNSAQSVHRNRLSGTDGPRGRSVCLGEVSSGHFAPTDQLFPGASSEVICNIRNNLVSAGPAEAHTEARERDRSPESRLLPSPTPQERLATSLLFPASPPGAGMID